MINFGWKFNYNVVSYIIFVKKVFYFIWWCWFFCFMFDKGDFGLIEINGEFNDIFGWGYFLFWKVKLMIVLLNKYF